MIKEEIMKDKHKLIDELSSRAWKRMVGRTCIWAVILFSAVTALAGLPGKAFAEAKVWADFSGDGFDDIAIEVASHHFGGSEDIGSIQEAGAVNVIYGSGSLLTSTGSQYWNQNSLNIEDSAEEEDFFGSSLSN
jgi:hypothetical protein